MKRHFLLWTPNGDSYDYYDYYGSLITLKKKAKDKFQSFTVSTNPSAFKKSFLEGKVQPLDELENQEELLIQRLKIFEQY